MTQTSAGNWGFLGFTVKRCTVVRAAPFVFTALILLAAGCAAETPTLSVTGGPPQIPHSIEGRDQCLLCHEAGAAGAPIVPANHVGRTSDICRLCHTGSNATAHSVEAQSTTLPAGAPAQILPVSGPPQIPHSLQGREGQCLLCHEAGVGGAPIVPVNHAGRTSDICTGCHQASAAGS